MAEELLAADLGRQVGTSGGRKTCRMGKNIRLRQGSSLPCSLGTAAAVPQGSHATHSGCSGGEMTRSLSMRTPPPPPLMPVRMPWAPPFPHQTQKGHLRPEHVPTSPQPSGTDTGLQPPAFCCSRCRDMSKAAKESSLQPQKQQCRIQLPCMSTSSPQASTGRRKEPRG